MDFGLNYHQLLLKIETIALFSFTTDWDKGKWYNT